VTVSGAADELLPILRSSRDLKIKLPTPTIHFKIYFTTPKHLNIQQNSKNPPFECSEGASRAPIHNP
jgi:hypothetical protein